MTERVLYAELTPQAFRERLAHAPIAYLPLGTLEWHGEHNPLGADGLQAFHFFELLARDVGGIVLPMLFMGPDCIRPAAAGGELYGMDVCPFDGKQRYADQPLAGSCYWLPESLFADLLHAVFKQIARAGFKIVVAHGHGPSTDLFLKRTPEYEAAFGLTCLSCRGGEDDCDGRGFQTGHAGDNETSILMHFRPDLVQLDRLSADPAQWPVAVSEKDPRVHADPDKGRRIVECHLARMAALLREALAG